MRLEKNTKIYTFLGKYQLFIFHFLQYNYYSVKNPKTIVCKMSIEL